MDTMSRKKAEPQRSLLDADSVTPVVADPNSADQLIKADHLNFYTSTVHYTTEPLPTLVLQFTTTPAPSMSLFNRLESLLIDHAPDEEKPKNTEIVLTFLFEPEGNDKRIFRDKIGSGTHLESVSTSISFPKKDPAKFLEKIDELQRVILIVSCLDYEALLVIDREANEIEYRHLLCRRLH